MHNIKYIFVHYIDWKFMNQFKCVIVNYKMKIMKDKWQISSEKYKLCIAHNYEYNI